MAMKPYDGGAVAAVVGGIPLVQWAPDNAVQVEYNEDEATLQIGVDGESAYSINRNKSGKFTFRLMQTSPSNDVLMAAVIAFRSKKILIPIGVKDLNGRATFACERAVPGKIPVWSAGAEAGVTEWVFNTDKLIANVGGNG